MRVIFDISQAVLDWSEQGISTPTSSGSAIISSPIIDERKKILQRGLNLHDSASDLLSYLRSNGKNLRGTYANQTSTDALSISTTEEDATIDSVSALAGISSGSFTVNGVAIQVNASTDSLNDVIDRINNSQTGAYASFNSETQKLSIASLRRDMLRLENGSANFFEGTNLKDGFMTGNEGLHLDSFLSTNIFQTIFSKFSSRFNNMFNLDFDKAFFKDYQKEIVTHDNINLEFSTKENFKEEMQRLTLENINKHIDEKFTSGAIRLSSDIELVLTENNLYFSNSKLSFNSVDNPKMLFYFLEAANGFLSNTVNTSNKSNTILSGNINNGSTTGLMIGRDI